LRATNRDQTNLPQRAQNEPLINANLRRWWRRNLIAAKRLKKHKKEDEEKSHARGRFLTEGFDDSTELAECPELSRTVNEGNEGGFSALL
jgi:hypothetical protein